jgi:hypothetical protein
MASSKQVSFYSGDPADYVTAFGILSTSQQAGPVITPASAFNLTSVKMVATTYVGIGLAINIYAADGSHHPTGSILATSDELLLQSGGKALVEFTFTTPFSMTDGVEYCLVIHANSGVPGTTVYHDTTPSHDPSGSLYTVNGGSSWVYAAGDSYGVELWGVGSASITSSFMQTQGGQVWGW